MTTNMRKPPGILIAFEGIDGSGKSTQARRLAAFFQEMGVPAMLTREPTGGPWGQRIRVLIRTGRHGITPEEEYRLFVNDRKEHVEQEILPALREGKWVIVDRYYFSTMAYQGALGLDPLRIKKENEAFAPVPDLLILLDIAPEEAISRIEKSRSETPDHFEGMDYLTRVREIFRTLTGPEGHLPYVHRIDANLSEDELFDRIRSLCTEKFRSLLPPP